MLVFIYNLDFLSIHPIFIQVCHWIGANDWTIFEMGILDTFYLLIEQWNKIIIIKN